MLFFRTSCGLTAVCLCDLPCLVFTLDWNSWVSGRGSWKICTTYVFLKLRSQGQSLDKLWRPCACLCVWEYVCEEWESSLVRGWRWICCVVSEQKVKGLMERWREGGRRGWEASPPHTVGTAASPFSSEESQKRSRWRCVLRGMALILPLLFQLFCLAFSRWLIRCKI